MPIIHVTNYVFLKLFYVFPVPNVASLQAPSNMPLGPLGQLTPVSSTISSAAAVNVASVPTVDLTDGEDDRADSREIVFNKLSGKTFPSLVVLARPNLRIKDLPPSKERASMGKNNFIFVQLQITVFIS
jgi:hypothetical protein